MNALIRDNRLFVTAVVAVVLLGITLRVITIRDGFWWDEIWSWMLARRADSLGDVLLRTRYDNNHPLNTLWIYLMGDGVHWVWYRLPSLLSGIASILLAGSIAGRQGRGPAVTAMLIFSTSMFLARYSTEARGYALLLCFGLLAYSLTITWFEKPTVRAQLGFCLVCLLGLLSHLTFLVLYLSLLAWAFGHAGNRKFKQMVQWFACPSLVLVAAYVAIYWNMLMEAGPNSLALSYVLLSTMQAVFSVQASHVYAFALTVLVVIISLGSMLRQFYRDDHPQCLFYASMLLGLLGLMVVCARNGLYWPRFAIIPAAFLYLLMNRFLWQLPKRSAYGLAILSCLLILFAGANLAQLRGGYQRSVFQEALASIAIQSPGRRVSVGSNATSIARYGVGFYSQYAPADAELTFSYFGMTDIDMRSLMYVLIGEEAHARRDTDPPPDWYLDVHLAEYPSTQQAINVYGQHYALQGSFHGIGEGQGYITYVYRQTERE